MATNPMQRKARNSFLLGVVLTLIVAMIAIGLLFMQLKKLQDEKKELEASYVSVLVLNNNVESGQEITASDYTIKQTTKDTAPTNSISVSDLGETTIAKINLASGTVLAADMLYIDATETSDDLRKQEYNAIVLPMDLQTGDYVDIRLMLPTGQDYIVVSKKQVEIPQIAGVDSSDTIWMNLTEGEILMLSNAIVDAYKINGSKLYATKYVEPGIQEASKTTYAVSGEVGTLIENDPNIVAEALAALRARYNSSFRSDYINPAISNQTDAKSSEESGMNESITKSQTSREEYLQSLSAGY
jgi:hypothetical protein